MAPGAGLRPDGAPHLASVSEPLPPQVGGNPGLSHDSELLFIRARQFQMTAQPRTLETIQEMKAPWT